MISFLGAGSKLSFCLTLLFLGGELVSWGFLFLKGRKGFFSMFPAHQAPAFSNLKTMEGGFVDILAESFHGNQGHHHMKKNGVVRLLILSVYDSLFVKIII